MYDDELRQAYLADEISRLGLLIGQPGPPRYGEAELPAGPADEAGEYTHTDVERAVAQLAAERGRDYASTWDAVRVLSAGQNDVGSLVSAVAELASMPEREVIELTSLTDDLSFNQRRELAAKGHSLGDFSYPIAHKGHLRAAAILAASGHGDVKEARKLILRRARELGVDPRTLPGFGPQATGGTDGFGSGGEGGAGPSGGGDSAMTAGLDDGIMQLAAGPVGELMARHPDLFEDTRAHATDEDATDTRQPRRGGRPYPGTGPVESIVARHPEMFGDVNRQRPQGANVTYPAKSAAARQREETRELAGGRGQNQIR